jgi:hypothetical protein
MFTIHKYPIPYSAASFTLDLPAGAHVLTVQVQDHVPMAWAIVDTDAPKQPREFEIFGTGWELPPGSQLRYISTIQAQSGRLVWHVFEKITAPVGAKELRHG